MTQYLFGPLDGFGPFIARKIYVGKVFILNFIFVLNFFRSTPGHPTQPTHFAEKPERRARRPKPERGRSPVAKTPGSLRDQVTLTDLPSLLPLLEAHASATPFALGRRSQCVEQGSDWRWLGRTWSFSHERPRGSWVELI